MSQNRGMPSEASIICEALQSWAEHKKRALYGLERKERIHVNPLQYMEFCERALLFCQEETSKQACLELLAALPQLKALPDVVTYSAGVSACHKAPLTRRLVEMLL